jgi:hypothetical protein
MGRRSDLTWRYLLNLTPTVGYHMSRDRLDGEASRVAEDLNRNGIALTSMTALFGDSRLQDELLSASQMLIEQRAQEIAKLRETPAAKTGQQKPFLMCLLGQEPKLDAKSVYGRVALHPRLLSVVHTYFRMHVAMRYYNIWYNLTTSQPPSQSQLWHRDPEDRYILKTFICLSDVDDGAGPFTYAKGTHPKAGKQVVPEYVHLDGATPRSTDAQTAAVAPPENWVKGIGPIGTMIFADTRGLHKGGLARTKDRVLYTCEFTSPSAGNGGIRTAGL